LIDEHLLKRSGPFKVKCVKESSRLELLEKLGAIRFKNLPSAAPSCPPPAVCSSNEKRLGKVCTMRVDGTVYRSDLHGVFVVGQVVVHVVEKVSTYENVVLNHNDPIPVIQHKIQTCGETQRKALILRSLPNFDVSEPCGSSSLTSNGLYFFRVARPTGTVTENHKIRITSKYVAP